MKKQVNDHRQTCSRAKAMCPIERAKASGERRLPSRNVADSLSCAFRIMNVQQTTLPPRTRRKRAKHAFLPFPEKAENRTAGKIRETMSGRLLTHAPSDTLTKLWKMPNGNKTQPVQLGNKLGLSGCCVIISVTTSVMTAVSIFDFPPICCLFCGWSGASQVAAVSRLSN